MNNRTLLLLAVVVFLYFYIKNQDKNQEDDIIEEYEEEPIEEEISEPVVEQNVIIKPDIPPNSMIEPKMKPPEVESSKCGSFVSSDLLPKPSRGDDFSEYSPQKGVDSNFLDGSRFLSMSTSLLRNSNLQIRPEPEVPREDVCPWNQSTIYRENTEAGRFREGGIY